MKGIINILLGADYHDDIRINGKALFIGIIICIFSNIISNFGIGCYYGCGLGTDPISVFVDGLHNACGLSYGTISTICNIILTVLIIIFERKRFGIGTFIGMLISGPLIDVFEIFVRNNFPQETTSLFIKILILLVGLISFAVGCGLSISCNMGIGCFQFPPVFLSDYGKIDLKWTQIATDTIFFIIGYLLGGVIGLGTVISIICTGPILEWTINISNKIIEKNGPLYFH